MQPDTVFCPNPMMYFGIYMLYLFLSGSPKEKAAYPVRQTTWTILFFFITTLKATTTFKKVPES